MSEPTTTRKLSARLLLVLIALAVVVVGFGALWVWSANSDAATIKLVNPTGGSAGGEQTNAPNGEPYWNVTYPLCTPTGAPVAITNVEPIGATGPVRVDWAVHHGGYGGGPDSGFGPINLPGFSHQPVTGRCNPDPNAPNSFSMIAFSIQATDGGPVAVQAFKVNFDGGSVVVPFSLEICPTKRCPKYPGIG